MLAVHRDVSPRKVALMRRYSTIALASTGAAVTTIDSFEDEAAAEDVFHAGVQKSGLPIKLLHMKALEALNILVSMRMGGGEECVRRVGAEEGKAAPVAQEKRLLSHVCTR